MTHYWIANIELDETGCNRSFWLSGTDRQTAIRNLLNNYSTKFAEEQKWIEERGSYFYYTWKRKMHYRGQYLIEGEADSFVLPASKPFFDEWLESDSRERCGCSSFTCPCEGWSNAGNPIVPCEHDGCELKESSS